MSSDIFVIYQIDNSEKNREYRCRSYEYQIQHGFMITADNYGTGYSGTATRGMGAEAIRKKMESINPDKFKIRKFGVSDVIGLTEAGKTSFFYVDKDRLVRFNGFFPKPQSGTYLILDEGGYQVAGQKGTWMVSDEVEVDGQRFVQMRSEQTKNPPPSIILHESGAFVTQTALGFDGEATRKMILAEIFAWYYDGVDSLTIYTQDTDAHEFQTNAERILTGNSEFTPALDSPISVAFKSNDFILCQMYREGALTLDAVRQLRRDDRKLTYTRQQADKSIICRKEVITKEQFIDLIQDATVQILF